MKTSAPRHASVRQALVVYLLLCALTILTWGVARLGLHGQAASLFVLGVALLKGQMIGDWFMGLRYLRGGWRWAILIWLSLVGGLISIAFYMANGGGT